MLADGAARSGAENMSSEPAAGVVVAAWRIATVSGLQEHRALPDSFLTPQPLCSMDCGAGVVQCRIMTEP